MARLAVAVGFAAATTAIGLGPSAGFVAGSIVGNLLFPPEGGPDVVQEGPRLGDLSITSSTYGVGIPITYGTMRQSGNMIWSTGIEEVRTTKKEDSGGKGGGGAPSTTTVTYEYFSTFALGFAEGPADDVTRLWADGKLIYDTTSSGDDITKVDLKFRFYSGDEEQVPDSLIESDKGLNETPAFRGLCYIVFERLGLRDFGNRVPQITAEITKNAAGVQLTQDINFFTEAEGGLQDAFASNSIVPDYLRGVFYFVSSSATVGDNIMRRANTRTMVEDKQRPYSTDANSNNLTIMNTVSALPNGSIIVYHDGPGGISISLIGPDALPLLSTVGPTVASGAIPQPSIGKGAYIQALGPNDNEFYPIVGGVENTLHVYVATQTSLAYVWDSSVASGTFIEDLDELHGICTGAVGNGFGEGYLFGSNTPTTSLVFYRLRIDAGANYDSGSGAYTGVSFSLIGDIAVSTLIPGQTSLGNIKGLIYDATDDTIMFQATAGTGGQAYMVKIDPDNGNVLWSSEVPAIKEFLAGMNQSRISDGVYGQMNSNDAWAIRTSTGEVFYQQGGWDRFHSNGTSYWDGNSSLVIGGSSQTETLTFNNQFDVSSQVNDPTGVHFDPSGTRMYVTGFNSNIVAYYVLGVAWDVQTATFINSGFFTLTKDVYIRRDGVKMYIPGDVAAGNRIREYTLNIRWTPSSAVFVSQTSVIPPPQGLHFKPDGTKMYVVTSVDDNIREYDLNNPWQASSAVLNQTFFAGGTAVNIGGIRFTDEGDRMYIIESGSRFIVEYSLSNPWDISTSSLVGTFSVAANVTSPTGLALQKDGPKIYATDLSGKKVVEYSYPISISKWLFFRGTGQGVPLDTIVSDLCQRAGLGSSEIDVTALASETVPGYAIGRTSTVRGSLTPLSRAYFFDGIESDYKLKFLPRAGKGVSASVAQEDLANIEEGRFFREDRAQEVELPQRFTITYMDRDRDYLQASHNAKRIQNPTPAMSSRNELGLNIPAALEASFAKQAAEKALYSSWQERSSYTFKLPQRFLALDPSDVIDITLDDGTLFRTRLTQTALGLDLSIDMNGLSEEAAQYTSTVDADGGDLDPQEFLSVATTKLILLTSPLLRDGDDTGRSVSILYFLMGSFGQPGWTAGSLLKSDEGTNFQSVGASTNEMAWGTAANALGDTDLPFQTDEVNTLTVFMNTNADDLSSVTQLEMLNGANAAALINDETGDLELIQFRDVVVNDDESRTLSGLLRGRRGTEVFTGVHQVGSTFVLLDTLDVNTIRLSLGEKDQSRFYKALTSGQLFEDALVTTKASPLNDLKPYAVKQIKATIGGGNDVTITWVRQTRVGGALQDGTGTVPLSEDSEEYELEIFDMPAGSEIREVLGLTSPTYVYTSAQQIADGLTPPITQLTVKIYQISAQVGRGFTQEVTLDVE